MERRNFMKTAGGIGVGALAGGLGLTTLTGGATATSSADYGNVMLSSDDGTVEYVAIFGSSTVTWDGFESDAVEFRIVNEARIPGEVGWTQLNDTGKIDLSQSTWGGDDEDFSGVGTSGTIETGTGVLVRIPPWRFEAYGLDIDHDEADQARTCFVLERVDGTVRCHLYYHARRDLLDEGDPDAPVDLTADHGGGV